MENPSFLSGLSPLEIRLIDLCRALSEDDHIFMTAKELLHALATRDFGMDEDDFEEECEEMESVVGPIEDYAPKSVGYAYRILLRMGLPWRNRYPFFDLRGMFGDLHDEIPFGPNSVELRLSQAAHRLLTLDKNPLLPLSLLNGVILADGTEIPSHNLEELWMAMEHLRQNPNLPLEDLMEVIPGPDFAAGGIIGGTQAIKTLYEKGEAQLTLRGDIETEIEGGRTRVAVGSLPQGVLITTILDQIRKVCAQADFPVYDIKNFSEAKKIRIVIDVSRATSADRLKALLYRETDLERSIRFRCAFSDTSAWSTEGSLISVLKEAVAQCPMAWKKKGGDPIDYTPPIQDILSHGGYKNAMSKLCDPRKTRILKIHPE